MSVYQPSPDRLHRLLALPALNWGDWSPRAAAQVPYTLYMQLPHRDREIVNLVGKFRQLKTSHIKSLVFPNQPHNPQARALKRLLKNKLLTHVSERLPGGARGGSSEYVYQLGSEGRRLFGRGRRGHAVAIEYHALAIADVYVQLFQANLRGDIQLLNYATEPDCHLDIAGITLKPDLYVDAVVTRDGQKFRHPQWLEIDMGTERRSQIVQKLDEYTRAYSSRDSYPLPIYPTVLFVAVDVERASELAYWFRYYKGDADYRFRVTALPELLTILQQ